MDSLNNLKTLWHTAKTDRLPSSSEMLRLVKHFRAQKLRNKWLVIVSSIVLAGIIIFALIIGNFHLLTTYVGGGLMAASSLLLATTNIRSLKRFYELEDCSNQEFLLFIETTRQNQRFYYQKTMVVILVLCVSGWLLYLYEIVSIHDGWLIVFYVGILAYVSFMWFYVRPRAFKKNAEKLDAVQQRLEKLNKQLNN